MKTVITKRELAERFAKSIPNVEKVAWGTERVTVYFDNIHTRDYSWEQVKQWAFDHYRGYSTLEIAE